MAIDITNPLVYQFIISLIILIGTLLITRIVSLFLTSFFLFLFRNRKLKQQKFIKDILENSTNIKIVIEFGILLLGTLIIFSIFNIQLATDLVSQIILYLPRILITLLLLYIGMILGSLVETTTAKNLKKIIPKINENKNQTHIINLISTSIKYLILIVTVITCLNILKIPTDTINILFTVIMILIMSPLLISLIRVGWTFGDSLISSSYLNNKLGLEKGTKIKIGDSEGTLEKITQFHIQLKYHDDMILIPINKFMETNFRIIK